jgi:hypothetical protein
MSTNAMSQMHAALADPRWASVVAIVRRATAHNSGQVIYGAAVTQPDDTTHLILTMSSWPRADESRLALVDDEECAAVYDSVTLDIRRHHDWREQPEPLPWFHCAHCGRIDNSDVT